MIKTTPFEMVLIIRDLMLAWLSANWINIALVAVLLLIVGLLLRGMIHDKKAGKSSCGCSCASCGACGGCSACGSCKMNAAAMNHRTNSVSGNAALLELGASGRRRLLLHCYDELSHSEIARRENGSVSSD